MSDYYDDLETRSPEERAEDLARDLAEAISNAKLAPSMARILRGVEPQSIRTREDLARLPVTRRSDLAEAQRKKPPFGGYATRHPHEFAHLFQSPGPVYEPGRKDSDWWRMGRAFYAAGVGSSDILHNCFGYHLTATGIMYESGAHAVGAAVLPAGTGQIELQVRAAADIGSTVYAGASDYLKVILEKADELGRSLSISRAIVASGTLFPNQRSFYAEHGIQTFQCYATPDLGCIAYETDAFDGMVVDEGVIVEVVRPGTGDPVSDGDIGEVVVTTLNPDYPLIRLATGDLSAVMPGDSACGRTNMRLRGWLGRVEQLAPASGPSPSPEQITALKQRHPEIRAVRIVVERVDAVEIVTVQLDAPAAEAGSYEAAVLEILGFGSRIELVARGAIPDDGVLVEDRRGGG